MEEIWSWRNGLFWGSGKGSKTVSGSTHVVEQLSFSVLPSILIFNFDFIALSVCRSVGWSVGLSQKLSQNQIQNLRKHRKWNLFNYMSRPRNSCLTLLWPPNQPSRTPKQFLSPRLNPKNSPSGPKKSKKNYPKIESKLKVRIEGNKENKSCCTI